MSTPILTTKLYVAPLRTEGVPRLRLIQRLDEGLRAGHQLLLLSTLAGFGKMSLLSDWLSQSQAPAAWLSLDDHDNEPARFWSHLAVALQTVRTDLGHETLQVLQAGLVRTAAKSVCDERRSDETTCNFTKGRLRRTPRNMPPRFTRRYSQQRMQARRPGCWL